MLRLVPFLLMTAISVAASNARATVVLDQPLVEHSKHASAVVRGTVEQQQAAWDESHKHIQTITKIRVVETLSGKAPASGVVTIRQPGGVVGNIGQHVDGTARFTVGEEVVVFLEPHRAVATDFSLVGLTASKFTVSRAGSRVMLTRDLAGLTLMKRDAAGKVSQPVANPQTSVSLDELRTVLRDAAKATTPARQ
jgi:hypothetical protein